MAEEMKGKRWDKHGPVNLTAEMKYPWFKWLNGSMWLLLEGEDFKKGDVENFRRYILNYASRWQIKVKTKRAENGRDLFIKAVGANSRTGLGRSRHFRAQERKFKAQAAGSTRRRDRMYDPELDSKDLL